MKIFFVRHGESLANVGMASSMTEDDTKNTLTAAGKAQIQKTARNIGVNINAVYSSPMYRTIESAKEFMNEGRNQIPFFIDDRLREIDYGIYTDDRDNPKMAQIAAKQIAGDYEVRFGGGENKREVVTRFFDFISDCYKQHENDSIVVFSHGRAISIIESEFCNVNKIHKKHIHTDNGTIKELEVSRENISHIIKYLKDLNRQEIEKRCALVKNKKLHFKTQESLKNIAINQIGDIDASYNVLSQFLKGLAQDNLQKIFSSGQSITSNNNGVLVVVMRDSANFIKHFWHHYKKIGVQNFVFIDNGSCDDTIEKIILCAQSNPDINLDIWEIEEKFDAIRAMGWKQKMMEFYGYARWYLNLDIDELLLIEQTTLKELTKSLEHNGQRALGGVLIDLYTKYPIVKTEQIKYQDILKEYKYYDYAGYVAMPNQKYKERIFGGMRTRMFGIRPSLQKIPLIYPKEGTLAVNPHFWYPYDINQTIEYATPILHYKFLPGDRSKCVEYIKTGVHYNNSSEYKAYYKVIEDDDTVFYEKRQSKERNGDVKTISEMSIKIKSIMDV